MKLPQSLTAALCTLLMVAPLGFAEEPNQTPAPNAPIVLENHWYTPFTRKYTPNIIPPINLSNSESLCAEAVAAKATKTRSNILNN